MKEWLKNKYVQWVLILAAGIAIGAIFYPSKTIREEERQKYERQLTMVKEQHQTEMKRVEEELTKVTKEYSEKLENISRKINFLKEENHHLKQKVEEGTLKIVRPDGTIVEKTYKKTETEQISQITTQIRDEFNRKVKSIENKWSKIHRERILKIKKVFDEKIKKKEEEIFELKKKKTVEINKRNFGISAGFLTNKNYYTGIDYTIFGPVFIDIHTQSNFRDEFSIGAGVGIRF